MRRVDEEQVTIEEGHEIHQRREDALARMVKEAESLGANAVVNVRFATSSITQGAAELFAYGTAVQVD